MDKTKDLTSNNKNDLINAAGKSIVGIVPFVGPLLSELVNTLIPNQRIDRLSKYVIELEYRLSNAEEELIKEKIKNEEYLSLIEEGYIHASRAITDDRRSYIASIVSNGLTDESIEANNSKYLLNLLSELNDSEVIWLRSYLHPTLGGDEEYREKHSNILKPAVAHIGAPDIELDKAALQSSYREHLERLGLIKSNHRFDRKTGMPEFDTFSGKPKVSYRDITRLGKMLLKQINLIEDQS